MQELLLAIRKYYDGYLPEDPQSLLDRFTWLTACGSLLLPEYRFKWPQMEWWNNSAFTAYLERFGEERGMNADRRWNLFQLLRLIADMPGDTAECGCYQGASSYLMCLLNQDAAPGRVHHIFDSFAGLSEPDAALDGTHWTKHALSATEAEAHAALHDFAGSYQLYKGWIPERFAEVAGRCFAFAHIDVDLYAPTRDSIAFFYPRLLPGGILLCDDYGFTSCPGATRAIDDFLRDKPEKMLACASGGGFFIKDRSVVAGTLHKNRTA